MLTEQLGRKQLFLIRRKQKQKLSNSRQNDTHKNGGIRADDIGSLFIFKQIFTMNVVNMLHHFGKFVTDRFVYVFRKFRQYFYEY